MRPSQESLQGQHNVVIRREKNGHLVLANACDLACDLCTVDLAEGLESRWCRNAECTPMEAVAMSQSSGLPCLVEHTRERRFLGRPKTHEATGPAKLLSINLQLELKEFALRGDRLFLDCFGIKPHKAGKLLHKIQ